MEEIKIKNLQDTKKNLVFISDKAQDSSGGTEMHSRRGKKTIY